MIQMIGRGLRTVDPEEYPGIVKTDCIVLDFGTSSLTHGTLEQDVDLDGREPVPGPVPESSGGVAMTDWTPTLVEERLAEAAFVLKRLPEPRRQGYFSTWPEMVYSCRRQGGSSPASTTRPASSADASCWHRP